MITELAQDQELLRDYLNECDELLEHLDEDLVALESDPGNADLLNRIFRAFHTIKGTSGFMGYEQIVELTHHSEDVLNLLRKGERRATRKTMDALLGVLDQLRQMFADVRQNTLGQYDLSDLLDQLKDTPSRVQEISGKAGGNKTGRQESARTIRVDVAKLDDLLNLVGELVLERNRLARLSSDLHQGNITIDEMEEAFGNSTGRLSMLTEEIQSASLRTRMVPIEVSFRRFPRLVRDLARNLGKEVELEITGEDTELDKTVVEQLADPLVHLVRNALDHGIERPEVRVAKGKPRQGTIRLAACQEGDHIVVCVSDDGAGIDPVVVAAKAVEKGMIEPGALETMSEPEILDLIFLPGFSTAEQISNISGRGVGMDVVRANLSRLNGTIELDSRPGQGSTVRLKLPLTLAILPVLLVEVRSKQGNQAFALPLRSIQEIVNIPATVVHRLGDGEIFRLRDRVVPLKRLRSLFHMDESSSGDGGENLCVVVLGEGEKRVGVAVDGLLGQEETVVKPLGNFLGSVPGLAGATISGDGLVRLMLDPGAILKLIGN